MNSLRVLAGSLKRNWKIWLILTLIIAFFLSVNVIAFTNMKGRLESTSPLAQMSLTSFLCSSFFGMIGLLIPIIYCSVAANGEIAKQVDSGSLSYLLNTPITRTRVALLKALYLFVSLIAMTFVVFLTGVLANAISSSGLDIGVFTELCLGLFLLAFADSGIAFLASCVFDKSGNSLAVGLGLPMVFFVLKAASALDSSLEWLKYFSLNTLYDPSGIAGGGSFLWQYLALALFGLACYAAGVIRFKRKDLPL